MILLDAAQRVTSSDSLLPTHLLKAWKLYPRTFYQAAMKAKPYLYQGENPFRNKRSLPSGEGIYPYELGDSLRSLYRRFFLFQEELWIRKDPGLGKSKILGVFLYHPQWNYTSESVTKIQMSIALWGFLQGLSLFSENEAEFRIFQTPFDFLSLSSYLQSSQASRIYIFTDGFFSSEDQDLFQKHLIRPHSKQQLLILRDRTEIPREDNPLQKEGVPLKSWMGESSTHWSGKNYIKGLQDQWESFNLKGVNIKLVNTKMPLLEALY
jgi:hypothetical protein